MKHDPCADQRDHFTTPSDEVTLEDVRCWRMLAERTSYPETRRVCLNLIADFYRSHPDLAPEIKKEDAA